jgi:hypothetical protein
VPEVVGERCEGSVEGNELGKRIGECEGFERGERDEVPTEFADKFDYFGSFLPSSDPLDRLD